MNLIQFERPDGERRVGVIHNNELREVLGAHSLRELSLEAIRSGTALAKQVQAQGLGTAYDYPNLLAGSYVLPPLDHPDPTHCLVSGTGLTHLGSAAARDQMHQQMAGRQDEITDSLKMFEWGVDRGKPKEGENGVQPEWFYKGDGSILVRPGAPLLVPAFAEDAGEEPEIAGLYVIGPDCRPYRVGFALGNEFSDHVMERRNYLYLAHSKLRMCAVGPELLTGSLARHIVGTSRILRGKRVFWEKPFLSGENNMSHSVANLEFHHFKYQQFLRPGDVHVHFFGTATLSFADGIRLQDGDLLEISASGFGRPLVNHIEWAKEQLPNPDVQSL